LLRLEVILLRLAIILPVFNDWASFRKLLQELAPALRNLDCSTEVIAVDDASSERVPDSIPLRFPITRLRILTLTSNIGHQRAIAIGLSSIADRSDIDLVAVMDADGEDRPSDLERMIQTATANPGFIAVARRTKRVEGVLFRFSYYAYKAAFWLLTDHTIDFGNFCVLPFEYVSNVSSRPELWNHFAATVVRARLPLKKLAVARGVRYAGRSKMNFVSLVLHGLGAISVFSEFVFARILIASLTVLAASALSILVVIGIRLSTNLAVPGWATNVFGFLVLIGLQAVMLPLSMAFMLLNGRAALQPSPKDFASKFIGDSRLFAADTEAGEIPPIATT
jgi:glycosyltransferase involved in cell wall biosynthesis